MTLYYSLVSSFSLSATHSSLLLDLRPPVIDQPICQDEFDLLSGAAHARCLLSRYHADIMFL